MSHPTSSKYSVQQGAALEASQLERINLPIVPKIAGAAELG
ncbi:MAG: hypothetical protein AAGG51_15185 [Cyanobacteria bacterium P01_G01_bin.54]